MQIAHLSMFVPPLQAPSVLRALCDCLEAPPPLRGEWRCALVGAGEQFAMMGGAQMMQGSSAGS